jgi:Fur family ferric uptake transcriptional regulator
VLGHHLQTHARRVYQRLPWRPSRIDWRADVRHVPAVLAPDIQSRLDVFLQEKGLRRTRQREVIVEAAFATDEHFTAEHLFEMAREIDATVSRATVYRTLTLLTESSLLTEIDLGRDVTYYDPNFLDHPHHNHLICVDCDKVLEFTDEHMNVLEDCITRRLGFRPTKKAIRIEGSCEKLRRTGSCKNVKN